MDDMDVDFNVNDAPPAPVLALTGRRIFELEIFDYIMDGGNIPPNNIIRQGWPGVLFRINQGLYNFDNDQINRQNNIANIYNGPHLNFGAKRKVKKSVKKTKKSVKKTKKSVKKTKKSVKKTKKSVKKTKKSVKI